MTNKLEEFVKEMEDTEKDEDAMLKAETLLKAMDSSVNRVLIRNNIGKDAERQFQELDPSAQANLKNACKDALNIFINKDPSITSKLNDFKEKIQQKKDKPIDNRDRTQDERAMLGVICLYDLIDGGDGYLTNAVSTIQKMEVPTASSTQQEKTEKIDDNVFIDHTGITPLIYGNGSDKDVYITDVVDLNDTSKVTYQITSDKHTFQAEDIDLTKTGVQDLVNITKDGKDYKLLCEVISDTDNPKKKTIKLTAIAAEIPKGEKEAPKSEYTIDTTNTLPTGLTGKVETLSGEAAKDTDLKITVGTAERFCSFKDENIPLQKVRHEGIDYNITPKIDKNTKKISFEVEEIKPNEAKEFLNNPKDLFGKQMDAFSDAFGKLDDEKALADIRKIIDGTKKLLVQEGETIADVAKAEKVQITDLITTEGKLNIETIIKSDKLTPFGEAFHRFVVRIVEILCQTLQDINKALNKDKDKKLIDASETVITSLTNVLGYMKTQDGFIEAIQAINNDQKAINKFIVRKNGKNEYPPYQHLSRMSDNLDALILQNKVTTTLKDGKIDDIQSTLEEIKEKSTLITVNGELIYCNTKQLNQQGFVDGNGQLKPNQDQLLLDAWNKDKISGFSISQLVDGIYANPNVAVVSSQDIRTLSDTEQKDRIASLTKTNPNTVNELLNKKQFFDEKDIWTHIPKNEKETVKTPAQQRNMIDEIQKMSPRTISNGLMDTSKNEPKYGIQKIVEGHTTKYITTGNLNKIVNSFRTLDRKENKSTRTENLVVDTRLLMEQKYGLYFGDLETKHGLSIKFNDKFCTLTNKGSEVYLKDTGEGILLYYQLGSKQVEITNIDKDNYTTYIPNALTIKDTYRQVNTAWQEKQRRNKDNTPEAYQLTGLEQKAMELMKEDDLVLDDKRLNKIGAEMREKGTVA